ncbi:MAG: hypothetical protein MRY63_07550 [Neomegalonema sp.]|nr:hypothetical protein [Neomegalonema sp.]
MFATGDGLDAILDFEDGVDRLDFSDSGLGFADLTIMDEGTSAVVSCGDGDRIEIASAAGLIDATDFVFA